MDSAVKYCPVCARHIEAENKAEVEAGEHSCYVFVHDDVPHTSEELRALALGIQ